MSTFSSGRIMGNSGAPVNNPASGTCLHLCGSSRRCEAPEILLPSGANRE